jgi:hypothetical protein
VDKIVLGPEDPTIFAICQICNKRGLGVTVGDIFCKAFTARKWKRNPVCDNCGGSLTVVREIEDA